MYTIEGLNRMTTMKKIYTPYNLPRHIVFHSPDGFSWGYGGSGPSELARCLLIEVVGEELANEYYQDFKEQFVSRWGDNWEMSAKDIETWVALQVSKM